MRRIAIVAGVVGTLLAGGLAATGAATASIPTPTVRSTVSPDGWAGANPAHNIAPQPDVNSSVCGNSPRSTACTVVVMKALDHARAVLHKPAYNLPSRFAALRPADQLLVLSNRDRTAYGLQPIRGLNAALDHNASVGANNDRDPSATTIGKYQFHAATSNWAGGSGPIENPAFAYYEWMYDDGPGSHNVDCKHAGDSGCWGHRHDTLWKFGRGVQVVMGAAGGTDSNGFQGWAELYESFDASAPLPYVPTVVDISHHKARSAGGLGITIRGYGFMKVTKVEVLGTNVDPKKHTPTLMTITAPRHAPGTGHIVVTTTGGNSGHSHATAFTYVH